MYIHSNAVPLARFLCITGEVVDIAHLQSFLLVSQVGAMCLMYLTIITNVVSPEMLCNKTLFYRCISLIKNEHEFRRAKKKSKIRNWVFCETIYKC